MGKEGRWLLLIVGLLVCIFISAAAGFAGGLGGFGSLPSRFGSSSIRFRGRAARTGITAMVDRFNCEASSTEGKAGRNDVGFERLGYASVPILHKSAAGTDLQVKQLTLIMIYDGAAKGEAAGSGEHQRILLGMKKRGFGEGKYNGFGGKVEAGETIEAAAKRELLEEANVSLADGSLEKRGVLTFFWEGQSSVMQIHLFSADTADMRGEPAESTEMRPEWFDLDGVPYDRMWEDDQHWFPWMLSGSNLEASFLYKGLSLSDHTIKRIPRPILPFCGTEELLEEALEGMPHIVAADVESARKASKRMQAGLLVSGAKVDLVPYLREHVERYHAWMQDEELREQTCSEPLTLEEEYEMHEQWCADTDKITFIVLDKEGAMVGDVNLFFYEEDEPQTCEINVMIADKSRRRGGMGAETVTLMLSYAWHRFGARKFLAKIGEGNPASISLFNSLGFKQEKYSSAFKQYTLAWEPKHLPHPTIKPFDAKET